VRSVDRGFLVGVDMDLDRGVFLAGVKSGDGDKHSGDKACELAV
jgi:hypothetical protein